MTQPLTTDQLEELLEAVIPCSKCGNTAMVMSRGHDGVCKMGLGHTPPFFRCVSCYQQWLQVTVGKITKFGGIRCTECKARFYSVESFSDYRPL